MYVLHKRDHGDRFLAVGYADPEHTNRGSRPWVGTLNEREASMTDHEKAILADLRENGPANGNDLHRRMGLTTNTMRIYPNLRELVRRGHLDSHVAESGKRTRRIYSVVE